MMETKYYTTYKYTNIPLIDEIPTNWTLGRVKNILDYTHYYPIGDGDHGSIKPNMYLDKGVPYIRVQNLSWNFDINYENLVYISQKVNKENRKSILKPGDILIAKTGATVGKMAIIPQKITEANTTSSVGKITINKEKYDNKYFAYLFLSYIFRQQIIETAFQKSAQPGFNIDDLIEFKILIPPKNEQEQIAKYLDKKTTKIEQTITKNKKLIILLKEKRTSLINQTVTKGLNPNASMKESGIEWIGKIPEHWNISKLKQYTVINSSSLSDSTPKDYEFEYVDIGSVSLEKGIEKYEKMDFKSSPSRARRVVKENDIIISTVRTYLKAIAVISNKENIIVSTGFAVLTPININYKYLGYFVKSEYFTETVTSKSVGVSYPAINSSELKNIQILIPSIEEQQEISSYLDKENNKINKTIEKIERNIELLEEYKESLIHHVVTGKIDVRGVEI